VPIPWAVLKLTSPGLEDTWLQLAGQIVQTLGGEIEIQQRQVLGSAGVLTVDAADSGVRLVALLAGLGWYAALRCGDPLTGCARRALLWAAWGLPAQALASLLVVGTLALGSAAAARWLLDPGIWLALAVLGVGRAEQLARRQPQQRRPSEPAARASHARA
jgi:hypothetical protein